MKFQVGDVVQFNEKERRLMRKVGRSEREVTTKGFVVDDNGDGACMVIVLEHPPIECWVDKSTVEHVAGLN
jgi:hypothetical protein